MAVSCIFLNLHKAVEGSVHDFWKIWILDRATLPLKQQCVEENTEKPYLQKGTRSLFLNNGLNTIHYSLILVCRSLDEENRDFVSGFIIDTEYS